MSENAGLSGGRLATPEKALIDVLYLASARSKLFRATQLGLRERLATSGCTRDGI